MNILTIHKTPWCPGQLIISQTKTVASSLGIDSYCKYLWLSQVTIKLKFVLISIAITGGTEATFGMR